MANMKLLCLLLMVCAHASAIPLFEDDDSYMHPHLPAKVNARTQSLTKNEETAEYWQKIGKDTVKRHKEQLLNMNQAKNVIFFLGDGMSVPTLAAARAYIGQLDGQPGEEYKLSFEKFPATGFSKTYCVDSQVADSACTATAYLTGVKANYETIGVTAAVPLYSCEKMQNTSLHTSSIAEWFLDKGRSAGIVTTTRVTHASPAGAYANVASREWESDGYVTEGGWDVTKCRDIAHQLVHENPGNRFSVILGGGRREFLPNNTVDEENTRGLRWDNRNLIKEWQDLRKDNGDAYEYVWNKEQLLNVNEDTDYLMGLFEGSHCRYNLEANHDLEPTLTEMVEAALKILSKNENGYFVFVEGGRIDHAHHDTRAKLALDETYEFSKAIARAVELTSREDTLIVVTSDHAHAMTYNGYPVRGSPIFGTTNRYLGDDDIPYATLSYANGPGYRKDVNGSRVDVSKEDMEALNFKFPAMVPLDSETHGGDDVGVFALGPQQQLFTGVYEQNSIPYIMSYAACIDEEYSACTENHWTDNFY